MTEHPLSMAAPTPAPPSPPAILAHAAANLVGSLGDHL